MSKLIRKLKNPGTVIGIASAGLFIATNVGLQIDNEAVMNVVKGVCSIGILLGLMNNPDTPGVDIPFVESEAR